MALTQPPITFRACCPVPVARARRRTADMRCPRNVVVSGRVVALPECFKSPTPTLSRRADDIDHLSQARPFITRLEEG